MLRKIVRTVQSHTGLLSAALAIFSSMGGSLARAENAPSLTPIYYLNDNNANTVIVGGSMVPAGICVVVEVSQPGLYVQTQYFNDRVYTSTDCSSPAATPWGLGTQRTQVGSVFSIQFAQSGLDIMSLYGSPGARNPIATQPMSIGFGRIGSALLAGKSVNVRLTQSHGTLQASPASYKVTWQGLLSAPFLAQVAEATNLTCGPHGATPNFCDNTYVANLFQNSLSLWGYPVSFDEYGDVFSPPLTLTNQAVNSVGTISP